MHPHFQALGVAWQDSEAPHGLLTVISLIFSLSIPDAAKNLAQDVIGYLRSLQAKSVHLPRSSSIALLR